ncbi:MAG: helix-turn-helix domain-containing protein [Dehalococcoidia bacterium]
MTPHPTRERAALHAALGDEHRLAIVDSLLRSDCTPTELGRALGLSSNLLAHHLDVLEAAGVIQRVISAGDRRRRYVRLNHAALDRLVARPPLRASHLLFVCTHNSARSQLAAALWKRSSAVPAESAGTHPAARIHPKAVAAAAKHGLDLSAARPLALDDLPAVHDLIVTVCDRAHEELPPRDATVLHWSIPDPAAVGTIAAFEAAYQSIQQRVASLAHVVDASPNGGARDTAA